MVETVSFRAFLEANWGTYGYGYLRWPGVEVTDETGKLPPYVSTVLSFAVARIETMVETVTATQPDSALQSFCRTQLAPLQGEQAASLPRG